MGPVIVEDIYKVVNNVEFFYNHIGEIPEQFPKNLSDYGSMYLLQEALQKPLAKYEEERESKRIFRLLNENEAEIMEKTTIFYDGPEGKIVMPHTKLAAQNWGGHTKWCISAHKDEENAFEGYYKKGPVLIFLPNPTEDDRAFYGEHYKSFKFAYVNGDWYDERDQLEIYPVECLDALRIQWEMYVQNTEYVGSYIGDIKTPISAEDKSLWLKDLGDIIDHKDDKETVLNWFREGRVHTGINFTAFDYHTLEYSPSPVDDAFLKEIICINPIFAQAKVPENIFEDMDFVKNCVEKNGAENTLPHFSISEPMLEDKAWLKKHIAHFPIYEINRITKEMDGDTDFAKAFSDAGAFSKLSILENSIRGNKTWFIQSLEQIKRPYEYLPDDHPFKRDEEAIRAYLSCKEGITTASLKNVPLDIAQKKETIL